MQEELAAAQAKLSSVQDSDSDTEHSLSSSVRSSISSRYGRRSSVPEAQVLARLSEDSAPGSPSPGPGPVTSPETKVAPVTAPRSSAAGQSGHSTNSLPRLGTSAIHKTKSSSSTHLNSEPSQPSNIATSTQGERE